MTMEQAPEEAHAGPTDRPLFDVVGLGARDYYEVALALEQCGMLHKLRTDFYTPDRLRSRIRKRYNPKLSSRKTSSNFLIVVASGLMHRLIRGQYLLHMFQRSIDYWFGFMAAASNYCTGPRRAIVYSYYLVGFVGFYRLIRKNPHRLICFQVHPAAAPIGRILDADVRAWEQAAGPTRFLPDAEMLWQDRGDDQYSDVLKRCDAVVCASNFTKASIAATAGTSKIKVVPYGSRFDDCDHPRQPRGQRIKLVSACQLTQRKGMHWAFLAMSQLGSELQSKFEWRIVAGARDPRIEALAPSNVVFLPRMSEAELAAIIADGDLFVMPSLVEGFGLVYIEALSLGTPIVYTSNTGAADFCQDRVHGFEVDVSDVHRLKKVFQICAEAPHMLATMRNRCRELSQSLTWSRFRSEIQSVSLGADH
jgi:glycosyltransferase involved in cell wall biosynthesis